MMNGASGNYEAGRSLEVLKAELVEILLQSPTVQELFVIHEVYRKAEHGRSENFQAGDLRQFVLGYVEEIPTQSPGSFFKHTDLGIRIMAVINEKLESTDAYADLTGIELLRDQDRLKQAVSLVHQISASGQTR